MVVTVLNMTLSHPWQVTVEMTFAVLLLSFPGMPSLNSVSKSVNAKLEPKYSKLVSQD